MACYNLPILTPTECPPIQRIVPFTFEGEVLDVRHFCGTFYIDLHLGYREQTISGRSEFKPAFKRGEIVSVECDANGRITIKPKRA